MRSCLWKMSKLCISKEDNFLAIILKKKRKAVIVLQIKFWTELNKLFNFGRNRVEAENFMDFGGVFLQTTFLGTLAFHVTSLKISRSHNSWVPSGWWQSRSLQQSPGCPDVRGWLSRLDTINIFVHSLGVTLDALKVGIKNPDQITLPCFQITEMEETNDLKKCSRSRA